jgi:hypothetical protein
MANNDTGIDNLLFCVASAHAARRELSSSDFDVDE